MNDAILHRVHHLFGQGRYNESIEVLTSYIETHGDNAMVQFYLARAYLMNDQREPARIISDKLLSEEPESLDYLSLSIDLDLVEEKVERAESKAELLIELVPLSTDAHYTMSRVKLAKRSYDKALQFAETALSLDSENIDALNLKIVIDGMLGKSDTNNLIDDALQLEPENPNSIANHAMQLIREGKIDQALERSKYALSLDPENWMAKHTLTQALRSRFWLYRLLFKYSEWMGRMSANMNWGVIIGSYLVYRFLYKFASTNEVFGPYLMPLVYLIIFIFLMTWILGPVVNFCLLANPYGQLLLDKEDKLTAKLVGSSLVIAIILLIVNQLTQLPISLNLAILFGIITIPLSTFLKVSNPKKKPLFLYATIGIFAAGLIGVLFNINTLFLLSAGGVFVYSWLINAEMIKENARVFE